jgi:hypothetical protein
LQLIDTIILDPRFFHNVIPLSRRRCAIDVLKL